jgi:hypothetical protein
VSEGAPRLVLPSGGISTSQSVDSKGRRITRITIDDTAGSTVQPNRQTAPGPIGNAPGVILPDTAPKLSGSSAPAIVPTPKEKGWWERWGSDVTHGLLDVAGFIPVLGAVPDLINAGVYAAEGNYVQAGISAVAAIPFGGDAVAAGNIGVKVTKRTAKELEELAAKRAAKEAEEKAAKEAEAAAAKKGGKDKGNPRCKLSKFSQKKCAPRTGHHVVADRAFFVGDRNKPSDRIPGGLSEGDGLVICVEGAAPRWKSNPNEHGLITQAYNAEEAILGAAGKPPGTTELWKLEAAGAAAVALVLKCNPVLLAAEMRVYHQLNGMGPDFKVRASALPAGLSRGTLGSGAAAGSGGI